MADQDVKSTQIFFILPLHNHVASAVFRGLRLTANVIGFNRTILGENRSFQTTGICNQDEALVAQRVPGGTKILPAASPLRFPFDEEQGPPRRGVTEQP